MTDRPADRATALVIQTAFLGDVILTTPLLARLAEQFGPVDIVTTPAAAGLLENHPAVASVISYDKRGRDRGWRGLWRIGSRLRQRRYARIYLPHRSVRSALLAVWSGGEERIGFDDSPAAMTYTTRIPRARHGHEIERLLALAGRRDGASPPVTLGFAPDDEAAAEAWLAAHQISSPFVAVAPGSVWATKRWPYYGELIARLESPVVLIGGPDDTKLADAITAASAGRAVSAAGALGLRQSAALIRRATVLVTNDSAPLHLATAVGTPVVAIFGPTVPEFGFAPRRIGDLTIGHEALACRPCSKHGPPTCPLGHHRCMRDLSVDRVLQAVATIASMEESRAICPRS